MDIPLIKLFPVGEIKADLRPERLLTLLATGLVIAIFIVILTVSYAALIFAGPLTPYIPLGITLFLTGNILMVILVSLFSSHASSISLGQDLPAAILALTIAAALATIPPSLPIENTLATTLLLIFVATFGGGILFLLIGRFKLSMLIRFLPYPVVGGFLAGTGWLLLRGAIKMITGLPMTPAVLAPDVAVRWLPGLVLAGVMFALSRRFRQPLLLPALFIAGVTLFYLVLWLTGTPQAEVMAQGWLLGPFPEGGTWQFPLHPDLLSQVERDVFLANLPRLLPVLLVATMGFLLNISGLELVIKREMDLSREMGVVGLANILSSLLGGLIGYQSLSSSTLNYKMSGSSRLTGLVAAAAIVFILTQGISLLSYLPKFALGAMLMYLGFNLLFAWVFQAYSRFSPLEYGVIWLILLVIAFVGFLEGIGAGVVAAVVLFVINYSQINVVKHRLNGVTHRSRVTRGREQRQLLEQHGEQIQIWQLQGYIFFGTAQKLLDQVKTRLQKPVLPPVRFLLLDFREVTGLDSTALLGFAKLSQLAQEHQLTLVLTHLTPTLQRQFETQGLAENAGPIRFFADMDRGMEWCEQAILDSHPIPMAEKSLAAQLGEILPQAEQVGLLVPYLEQQEVEPGFYLIHQGDAPDELYFVEQGQVTAQLELDGRAPVRLETMRGGRVVGEIGFYLATRRSAAVRADEPTTIYRLSLARLTEMEQKDPAAAATFHRLISYLLAERATHLIRAVDALLK
ncbi:MAG: cyclic nucleotide-binding domain-containing protein [Anaerolineae bacterium]|nr:cyclic nucleotide-binding domain-containing protein [Anaerolineae bacterium]